MTQSTGNGYSVREAADRLNSAVKSLEGALSPLVQKVADLEREREHAQSFDKDRARLASELDEAAARENDLKAKFKDREDEFAQLASETTAELDSVISEVLRSLGGHEGGGD